MATNDFEITNTVLQSLFGPSPEQQTQAYERARDNRAMQLAQLTPGRGSVFAAGQTAQDLEKNASALGGAVRRNVFGIETPKEIEDKAVEKIKAQAQPLLQQGDMAGYADFLAQEYSKAGLTERAARAKTAAEQFRLKQAELAKVRSEETRNLAQAQKAMQEQGPKFANEVDKALYEDFLIKANGNAGVAARMYSEYKSDLRQKEAKAGVAPQEKAILKNKATLAEKLETGAVDADNQLVTASSLRNVINNSFTGFGSGAVLKVGQIADALGVTVSGTTETEQLNQLLSKLAQGQAKSLPGSLSEKELTFLREAIGTGGVTKQTLQSMVNRMEADAFTTIIANKQLQSYQSSGKDLNKFDFSENIRKARRAAQLLQKASPEERKQILGY